MKLVLFFSRGISLDIWRKSGLLARELAPYRRMQSLGENIDLVTYGRAEDAPFVSRLRPMGVLHNRWGLPSDMYAFLSPFLYRKRMRGANVFKTNQINGWWAAGAAKFLFRKPLIVRCGFLLSLTQEWQHHGPLRTWLVSLLEKAAFRYADAVTVTTQRIKAEVMRRHGIPGEKIRIIPSPVDADLFRPDPDVPRVEGRLGFVGRMSPEKNLDLLLEAVRGLRGVSLILVGDGPLRPALEKKARESGIDATFHGTVPNERLPGLLNTCRAFVLPSRWEGMPKAVIEAMSCGLPVIGTDVPGIRDLVQHGRTGYLCAATPEGLRSAIHRVLDDRSLRERLGKTARSFVTAHYALEQVVRRELDLMAGLAGS